MSRKEAVAREQATTKSWVGIADGAPLGTGVPESDWVGNAQARGVPDALVRNVVLLKSADDFASGTHFHVYDARRKRRLSLVCTCKHVIPDEGAARITRCHFDYEGTRRKRTRGIRMDPDTFYARSRAHDVAIVALAEYQQRPTHPPVALGKHAKVGTEVAVVQHPNASPKVIDHGAVRAVVSGCLLHTANTLPGSSGAPLCTRAAAGGAWRWTCIHCTAVDVALPGSREKEALNMACTNDWMLRALRSARLTLPARQSRRT